MPVEKREPRLAMVSRGAEFWIEDGRLMFRYVIDPGSIVGPQPAKDQDKLDHPEAWAKFQAEIEPTPVVASEAAPRPTPQRRGPGRPRKKSAGHDASDHDSVSQ